MDIEKIKQEISVKSAEEIYNEYIISGEVWIFKSIFDSEWYTKYDEFKKYISKKLNVHYNNIGIAGSAKMGFSLNPEKNFKAFDENSDVDIIIVSRKLFNEFWEQYLNDSYNPTTRIKNITYVSFCIFRKYLTLDNFRNNAYYNQWQRTTDGFEKDIQLQFQIDNEVHYRIFESWDSVKMYYISSVDRMKTERKGRLNEDN